MSATRRAVGLISGGLDSTVVAAYMDRHYDESHYVFGDYGQKTLERELQSFEALKGHFNPASARVVNLRWLRDMGNSALFEDDTTLTAANRKREYVPFRNATLLSAAVALAETVEAEAVMIGSTGGDRTCPDNSPAFVNAYTEVIRQGTMTDREITVVAHLIELDKQGVIQLGAELDAPFELSWSCHNNLGSLACGQCSNCEARVNAFDALGMQDPIQYQN